MAVQPVDKDRMARGDYIDRLPRGQARGRPVLMVPAAARNPAAGRLLGGELRDAPPELVLGFRAAQLHAGPILAATEEMYVRIVEARQHQLAAQIDHLGASSNPLADLAVRPYRDDAASQAGRRLRAWPCLVHRPNLAVQQHQAG